MIGAQLIQEAKQFEAQMVQDRRYLHNHAETGFELQDTIAFVKRALTEIGYTPQDCGKSGVVALAGGKKPGRVFLLRADMDALPIQEESRECFAAVNGNMHACGHDLHTAMLLGAARLLKAHEDEINGTVKLMFQPAEEIFEGACDMLNAGVLKNPDVDAAMVLHVIAASPLPVGTVTVSSAGVSNPAADYFEITVQGKGCHGSMSHTGVDPINVAAHIFLALQELNARELAMSDQAALTIGVFQAGVVANVLPDTAVMRGTIRTCDETVRAFLKQRIPQLAQHTAAAFRAEAQVLFSNGCPVLFNEAMLAGCVDRYTKELLGSQLAVSSDEIPMRFGDKVPKGSGSEDFAYVSQQVPTVMLTLAAGEPEHGYTYPQHHPKVKFDERILVSGSAVYAYNALRWLEEH